MGSESHCFSWSFVFVACVTQEFGVGRVCVWASRLLIAWRAGGTSEIAAFLQSPTST